MMLITLLITLLFIYFQLVNSQMNPNINFNPIPTAYQKYLDDLLDDCRSKLTADQMEAGNKLKNDLNNKLHERQRNFGKCVCSEITFVDPDIGSGELLSHPYIRYMTKYYDGFGYYTYMRYKHGWPLTLVETPPKVPIYCVSWTHPSL